jgi:hypothetical protein
MGTITLKDANARDPKDLPGIGFGAIYIIMTVVIGVMATRALVR